MLLPHYCAELIAGIAKNGAKVLPPTVSRRSPPPCTCNPRVAPRCVHNIGIYRTEHMNYPAGHDQAMESFPSSGQISLRRADLSFLVSLDVLLQECNVTRAAKRMHLSQPALSYQLARLRQLFNDPLLVSSETGRGLVPSQFALNLHRRLKPALSALSCAIQVNADVFCPAADARCFTIAATNTAAAMMMPVLLEISETYGNRHLKFVTIDADFTKVSAQLESGDIDLFLSTSRLLPPGLCVDELFTTPHVLVQRSDHPRGNGPVSLQEYCDELDHINIAHDSGLHGYIDEQLYRRGQSRYVKSAFRDFSFVPAVLKRTDLVCTLPTRLVNSLDRDLEFTPLSFPLLPYILCMAWHERSRDDDSFLWLRGELKNAASIVHPQRVTARPGAGSLSRR